MGSEMCIRDRDGTFKPLRDVDEKGTSYTLDQISDGTVKVVEVK